MRSVTLVPDRSTEQLPIPHPPATNTGSWISGVLAGLVLAVLLFEKISAIVRTHRSRKPEAGSADALRTHEDVKHDTERDARLNQLEREQAANWRRTDELRKHVEAEIKAIDKEIAAIRVEMARLPGIDTLRAVEGRLAAQISNLDSHVSSLAQIAREGLEKHVETFHQPGGGS